MTVGNERHHLVGVKASQPQAKINDTRDTEGGCTPYWYLMLASFKVMLW
jgi:hypothetical protein